MELVGGRHWYEGEGERADGFKPESALLLVSRELDSFAARGVSQSQGE